MIWRYVAYIKDAMQFVILQVYNLSYGNEYIIWLFNTLLWIFVFCTEKNSTHIDLVKHLCFAEIF